MRLRQSLRFSMVSMVLVLLCGAAPAAGQATWKVGTARAVITPKKPFWMAGFGSRNRPAEGAMHDLWIKVLALEDAHGRIGVVFSGDFLGVPKGIYDSLCRQLKSRHGLDRSQIMLTASHTHSGPVLRDALYDIYPLDDQQRALIEEYSDFLEKTILEKITEALSERTPATLWAGQGTAGFAVNRRTNRESDLPDLIKRGVRPKGPSDYTVPVLAVRSPDGKLRAVVCGYAAHTSALHRDPYLYSGDYAGFTQIALEKSHPGAQAMYFQGCGSDQSAAPRDTLQRCRVMGEELADSVQQVLDKPMKPLDPHLHMAFEFVKLDFQQPTKKHLEATAASSAYPGRWARRLLKELEEGKTLANSYPEYPVQVWKLGRQQLWITMGGEVAVDYSLMFKKKYGPETWVAGYTNDVMAYIPSQRIWKEGGYQAGAFTVYGLPAVRWTPDIEKLLTTCVERLVEKVK